MKEKIAVVVTSIAGPNSVLQELSAGCGEHGWDFIVIGDQASPADFRLNGCAFYDLAGQRRTGLKSASKCPTRHYARKNIGYLLAIQGGSSIVIETDDDNVPYRRFWNVPECIQNVPVVENAGWVNVYRYFTDQNIWPRGFPLEQILREGPAYESLGAKRVDCPIQQNLADDNPDVDAIYRLTSPLPQRFVEARRVAIGGGCWCPFNSQNTIWWAETFRLLYLPAYCSFRMTDIWRSFVAQRITQLNGWAVLFGGPTVRQQRNEHNLLRDFSDEIPGYLNNGRICEALADLRLEAGVEKIADNMRVCYEKLVDMSCVGREELDLLDAWFEDIEQLC